MALIGLKEGMMSFDITLTPNNVENKLTLLKDQNINILSLLSGIGNPRSLDDVINMVKKMPKGSEISFTLKSENLEKITFLKLLLS